MQITSLSLRNYRVFAELELEVPPGLVGVYGANGSGKSTLLESVLWALYGRARTGKGDIKTSGATGECVVELGFEHDSHHYMVRRSISGINATVKARVLVGGEPVADGITDVARYVRSTLGMDEAAFRSSVFAEQKQLAAFSDQSPDQRRRLVLQLLGITPIEKARDVARSDYRARQTEHSRLQTILGPMDDTAQRVEAAQAQRAEAAARAEHAAVQALDTRLLSEELGASVTAGREAHRQDQLIRQQGLAARRRRDDAAALIEPLLAQRKEFAEAAEALAALDARPEVDIDELERAVAAIVRRDSAQRQLDGSGVADVPDVPDPGPVEAARAARDRAGAQSARAEAELALAMTKLAEARQAVTRSQALEGEDSCPTCGQEIAGGSAALLAHRQRDLLDATKRSDERRHASSAAQEALEAATKVLSAAERAFSESDQAHREAMRALDRRRDLEQAAAHAAGLVDERYRSVDEAALRAAVRDARAAVTERARLQERIERVATLDVQIAELQSRVADADRERSDLRRELEVLGFDAAAFAALGERHKTALAALDVAQSELNDAQRIAAVAEQRERDAAEAAAEAARREERLRELAEEARYLGRTADLLAGFRHTIVGLIGPQLSAQASDLFNDLTNGEYDGLAVDPDSYEITILDGGVAYPSDRFSGSEVDLANLALRVAISEQVRFQAGGQVGLLVLDEALASLDTERKDRMLGALTRLSGRFRQILVVTHAPEVKERLPQAIEVVKLGARRSTARVIDQFSMDS